MKIYLAPYNPEWPHIFEKEKTILADILTGTNAVIEHIGSTAVPGLGAKPIIDIQIGLPDFKIADEQVLKIISLGYEYISKWEIEIPNRRFFRKEKNGVRTHHIHLVGLGTDWWERHLRFRDYLRKNDEVRDAYFSLKKELAARDWEEMNHYAYAKTEFIRRVEAEAKGVG